MTAELKGLFVTGYVAGLRRGEITAIQWQQVDFEAGLITLDKGETKNDERRSVPILDGDMHDLLVTAKKERDEKWPQSPWVLNRGEERIIVSGGRGMKPASEQGSRVNFHDLRRTAVRNMRRAGILPTSCQLPCEIPAR